MTPSIPSRESNPFSSCWLGPHGLQYDATESPTPAILASQLARDGWRGQIVGPHGAGKSTLLAAMRGEVEALQRSWVELRFRHSGRQSSAIDLWQLDPSANSLLVIDGYEQLSWLARGWVRWQCWRRNCGLLITTHQAVQLPMLLEIAPTEATAVQVFRTVAADTGTPVTERDARVAFNACNRNMRNMFEKLYDLHEQRNRSAHVANNRRPQGVVRSRPTVLLD